MKRILLVEDDEGLSKILATRFSEEHYRVTLAKSLSTAREAISKQSYDIAIIDVNLPDGDGFSLARELPDTPFLFLTAMSSPEFRLEGYELGAADYIPKPFHFKELKLRIDRIIAQNPTPPLLRYETLTLNPETLSLHIPGKESVPLAKREFDLIYYLIHQSPKVISREAVLQDVWHVHERPNPRTVDNAILKVRHALGEVYSAKLKSIRGEGYQWE
ncbi:MAG: response regulator transcription factor [Bdellovibrionales bacterium]|nr:response regulator transcription factor [Bdellovibrionales bacterium]